MKTIEDKVIVITGASSGMGANVTVNDIMSKTGTRH